MKSRAGCLSVSKRNKETWELVEEYADMWGMSKASAVFHCIREFSRYKLLERIRELEKA